MDQLISQKAVRASGCTVLDLERARIHRQFQQERKKLEEMVAARFRSGHTNMGADSSILKQSDLLDRLVVNEMELEEYDERYNKDQLCD